MTKQQLYFIAIMLPPWVDEEIISFKNDIAHRFHSKKALRTASHITLEAPFKTPASLHDQLLQWFNGMTITVAPFMQEVKDFGAFNNKRNPVIYVAPVMNASLALLRKEVGQNYGQAYPKEVISQKEFTFSPHITIAYRDLSPQQFTAAWKEYQTKLYAASFVVNSFQLLQHINGRWNVISNFLLNSSDARRH